MAKITIRSCSKLILRLLIFILSGISTSTTGLGWSSLEWWWSTDVAEFILKNFGICAFALSRASSTVNNLEILLTRIVFVEVLDWEYVVKVKQSSLRSNRVLASSDLVNYGLGLNGEIDIFAYNKV